MELTSDCPYKLPFKLLQRITNNFSEERKLGCGTFGQVYKGVRVGGEEIAVKLLHRCLMPGIVEQQFQNEFANLKRFKHENIIGLLGFCDETEEQVALYEGKSVLCHVIHRAICLEYMQNGSLANLLSDEYKQKDWPMLYRIIKGICEGLKYLHEGLEDPILHLDLKLDNILLDQHMAPKIADFGISRLIGERNTKVTMSPLGTRGYLPPEFIDNGIISKEYDIFSLGAVLMKIIFGPEGRSIVTDVNDMYRYWRSLQETREYAFVEQECKQVRDCIEIALTCMDNDRNRRPKIKDITSKFEETDFFSSLQQHPATTPDVSNIQWMHMQQETKAGALQRQHDQQQCMVVMQPQSQKNQLQQSQHSIMLHCQSQPIQLQPLFWMLQQPSLQQQILNFVNKLVEENNINLQMQYIQAQMGLQGSSSIHGNVAGELIPQPLRCEEWENDRRPPQPGTPAAAMVECEVDNEQVFSRAVEPFHEEQTQVHREGSLVPVAAAGVGNRGQQGATNLLVHVIKAICNVFMPWSRWLHRWAMVEAAAPMPWGPDDADEFRRTVEAFIEQQTRFHREQSLLVAAGGDNWSQPGAN